MASNKNPRLAKAEIRSAQYRNLWATGLSNACISSPGFCCLSIFCPWCVSYHLRKRALHGDMSRYLCCNGDWPCSGRCGEQRCPGCCLCFEVTCCFPQSVASTRWMIQDEQHLMNTKCDNCIIGTTIAAQYLSCLCWCVACISGQDSLMEAARILDWIADFMWCSMCACMNAQHKVQLDLRDKNPGAMRPPHPMLAPNPQVMQQPYPTPPSGSYVQPPPPPASAYAYPPPPK